MSERVGATPILSHRLRTHADTAPTRTYVHARTHAQVCARRKGTEVDIEDVGRVYSMFVDVKRSTQVRRRGKACVAQFHPIIYHC